MQNEKRREERRGEKREERRAEQRREEQRRGERRSAKSRDETRREVQNREGENRRDERKYEREAAQRYHGASGLRQAMRESIRFCVGRAVSAWARHRRRHYAILSLSRAHLRVDSRKIALKST